MPITLRHISAGRLIIISLCTLLTPASWASEAPWVGTSLKGAPCNGLAQGFGPYDYLDRNRLADKLKLVEGAHFDMNVESLTSGAKNRIDNPLPDLDYTLRAFPNHHRALNALITYDLRDTKAFTSKRVGPAECYLQRALNFSPKDATTHMLYAIFLHRGLHYSDAMEHYEEAMKLSPNNAQIMYNYSLLLVDLERYQEARNHAVRIYAQGFPLQGLKKRLQAAGSWAD
jgi:tetratricopeptide (TPR) repeat protein